MTHGTTGYRKGCRCDACRLAMNAAVLGWQQRNAELRRQPPVHGTVNGYNGYRCRCDACKAAYSRWQRAYRSRGAS